MGCAAYQGRGASLDDRQSTGASVYEMFFDTSVRGLIALNIGSLTGGLLLILFADNVNRVTLQKVMFLVLAALFITLGSMFTTLTTSPPAVVALYIVGQIVFNFGMYCCAPPLFPSLQGNRLTPNRPQRNNIHDTGRSLPNSISSHLPWPQCRRRQTGLYPR